MAANQEQNKDIEKLLRMFSADRIVMKDEVEALLDGLVTIIETFQEKSTRLNTELEVKLQRALTAMAEEHNNVLTQLEDGRILNQENAITAANEIIDQANERIDALIVEVKSAMPKDGQDGKDADETVIIESVLQRIKLPEYKELQLDSGEEIVDKINELPTDDEEKKIDANHIKNLPKSVVNNFRGGGSGIKGVTSNNFLVTDDATYAGHKNISIPIQATAPANPFEGMLWIDNS